MMTVITFVLGVGFGATIISVPVLPGMLLGAAIGYASVVAFFILKNI